MVNDPSWLMVEPKTRSPEDLVTGMLSPVIWKEVIGVKLAADEGWLLSRLKRVLVMRRLYCVVLTLGGLGCVGVCLRALSGDSYENMDAPRLYETLAGGEKW